MIVRKTAAELEKMRRSGLLVYQLLQKLKEMAVEGATTMDLEVTAEKLIAGRVPVEVKRRNWIDDPDAVQP